MARPKNPSKKFKRDPTNSQRRINAYERELVKLFKNYKIRVVTDLKQMNSRSLESVRIDPKAAGDHLTRIEQEEILDPATKIVNTKIPESYKAGETFADLQLWVSLGGTKEQRQNAWKKIAALIEKNIQSITKVSAEVSGKIRQILANAVINEGSLDDMIDEIYAVADVGVSRARTIARTEIMIAVNTGIKDRYKQAGVEKGEWLAASDDIVCPSCEALDGQQFPLDSFPPCPDHPACRCSIIPVIEIPEDTDE